MLAGSKRWPEGKKPRKMASEARNQSYEFLCIPPLSRHMTDKGVKRRTGLLGERFIDLHDLEEEWEEASSQPFLPSEPYKIKNYD